ncbi:AraC family transcriptional regulator [Gorillibacterium timonense]|uniref:AraC family transcriptional regulator n=1 Tax=Gorillibacterium timonense TaxID=1689269 RepID=UPI001F1656EC|nr:AraC family transcriptional regulator [Gorillibacterium timonense]
MDYLEAHLTEEVNPDELNRILACPYSVFQRSFAPITGMQLSDYLRRRRLTRAAYDLQNTDKRVIDVAVKYGYDSADAFTAAFKRMHGITPHEARKPEANLKFHPRLTFTFRITGVSEMNYRYIEKEPFGVLGIRRTTPQGGGTWAIVKTDGSAEQLRDISGHSCDLGLCFGFDQEDNNDYMCGVEYEGTAVPGFDHYHYPATAWLVFTAEGAITSEVLGQTWKRIYGEFMPQSPYKQLDLPTIEKYIEWDDVSDRSHVEIYIPVQK